MTIATAIRQDSNPDWVKVTEMAGWRPRDSQGKVVYKGRMWIFGGPQDYLFAENDRRLKNDVWCSADGKTWFKLKSGTSLRHEH